jgi:hypothetical protein
LYNGVYRNASIQVCNIPWPHSLPLLLFLILLLPLSIVFNVFHYSVFICVYNVLQSYSPPHPLLLPSTSYWFSLPSVPLLYSCPYFCFVFFFSPVCILHMRENVIFVFLSLLILFNMMISSSIYFPANSIILFFQNRFLLWI